MKPILIATLLSVWPIAAIACEPGEQRVFSCTTSRGKQVEVCQASKSIRYAYGAPNKPPELRITTANEAFSWEHDEGVSSGIEDNLTFENGSTRYLITHVANFDDPSKTDATLVVMQPSRENRYIGCESGIVFDESAIKAKVRNPD